MQIDADARLAAAAGGAARYFGDAAGLENDAIAHLQAAIVSACIEAFDHLTQQHPHLGVTLTRLADRIEIALSHEGEGNPTQANRNAGDAAGQTRGSTPGMEGIDRIQHETRGSVAVTLLTKYIAERNARR
jgi:hypothetical protein